MLRMGDGHDAPVHLEPLGRSVCPDAAEGTNDPRCVRDVPGRGLDTVPRERGDVVPDANGLTVDGTSSAATTTTLPWWY